MKNELNVENVQVAGYMHFYIKDGQTKTKIIPVELKDSFIATPKDINGLSVKEWLSRKEAENFTI